MNMKLQKILTVYCVGVWASVAWATCEYVGGVGWEYETYQAYDQIGKVYRTYARVLKSTAYSGNLVVPDKLGSYDVKQINYDAFQGNTQIASITFPDSVNSIGSCRGCTSLKSIRLPSTLTTIGWNDFTDCTALESITFPSGLTEIGNEAFLNCTSLTSISIPATVKAIMPDAFRGCSGLGNGLVVIDGCVLTMNGTCSENVVLPEGTRIIAGGSFRNCTNLKSIALPKSLAYIGGNAFDGCTNLATVDIADIASWCAANILGMPTARSKSISLNGAKIVDLVIPEGITEISGRNFYGCANIKSVTLPSSMARIGRWAFQDCTGISTVNITDFNKWCMIEMESGTSNPAYYSHQLTLNGQPVYDLYFPNTLKVVKPYTLGYLKGMRSIRLPPTLTTHSDDSFVDSEFETVQLSAIFDSMCDIFRSTFGKIQHVVLEDGISVIPAGTFYNCAAVQTIEVRGTLTDVGKRAFTGCTALRSFTLPEGMTTIGESTFSGCAALAEMKIPESVTGIEQYAFYGSGLKTLSVPASAKDLGNYSFDRCNNLTRIEFANCETKFSQSFDNCPKIVSVKLPKLSSRLSYRFGSSYEKITDVSFCDGVEDVPEWAFYRLSSLRSVTFPASIKTIGKYSFYETTCGQIRFAGPPPTISGLSQISLSVRLLYNVEYEDLWLPYIAECGFTNTMAYRPVGIPGLTSEMTANWITNTLPTSFISHSETSEQYYQRFTSKFGTNLDDALTLPSGKKDAYGNAMYVWQDMITGTDPTNPKSVFTAKISMETGAPQITWEPALNGNGVTTGIRTYKVHGANSLDASWKEVDPANPPADIRFFKVTVSLPE